MTRLFTHFDLTLESMKHWQRRGSIKVLLSCQGSSVTLLNVTVITTHVIITVLYGQKDHRQIVRRGQRHWQRWSGSKDNVDYVVLYYFWPVGQCLGTYLLRKRSDHDSWKVQKNKPRCQFRQPIKRLLSLQIVLEISENLCGATALRYFMCIS